MSGRMPTPGEVRALLARGSGSRVGRGDFGQNPRNLPELWQAFGLGE